MVDFSIPADHRMKPKESRKRDKYLDLSIELKKKKKTVEHENDNATICNWGDRYSHQSIDTGTGGLGNKRTSRDHSKYKHC